MVRRCIHVLVYDLLLCLIKYESKPLSMTNLMYKVNLSGQKTHELLDLCRERGLVQGFTVTNKGLIYIDNLDDLNRVIL